jgi:hypothetical protein
MFMIRILLIASLGLTSSVVAEDITLTGGDAFTASQKSTCGTLEEGRTRYGIFEGRAWSRVPGEKDRHLFDVLGINVRHCNVVEDENRGRGFRSVSREIMVYFDPETGEVADEWKNPWSGETIQPIHVANDPVNMRSIRYERNEDGTPADSSRTFRRYGDIVASSAEIPLFYENPLGGEFQAYVGGRYHAMEIFNSFYAADRILDNDVESVGESHLAWSRVAQWLPWMEMGDRPGLMIFNATGFSTFDKSRIPDKLKNLLDERYPTYWTPPPLDDDRPNETSWTVFRKHLEARSSEQT